MQACVCASMCGGGTCAQACVYAGMCVGATHE